MSPSSSTIGESLTMPAKLRNLVQVQKPEIKINFTTKKTTYTTLDRIEGVVAIVAPIDTPFDAIDVEFVGTNRTYVERVMTAAAATGRSEAFHQFLKLSQPGLHEHYPEDLVLKAGTTYEFPFVFAVPQQLLPRVCQHPVQSDAIRDAHMLLPPTLGDRDLGQRQKGCDDLAPDMASVRYGIFVKITELRTKGDDFWRSIIASKARRLRVVPRVEEQPPLDVHQEDGEYVLRKEKPIKKGLLKGKLGTLVMETVQPPALRMRSYNNPEERLNTMATVMLRFDPLDDSLPPPKLGSLSSKLKATTYFGSTARQNIPSKSMSIHDLSQGLHSEQMNLSSRCVANVEWEKVDPDNAQTFARRDSALSTCSLDTGSTPEPSENYKGNAYYTARILVPVTLPGNKAFVPSFHSCLISRVYALKLDLSISSAGFLPSMELKVPVQISSEGLVTDHCERRESVDSTEGEIEAVDVSDFFTNLFEPRTIRVPSETFVGRSRIGSQAPVSEAPVSEAPPGYSPFSSTPRARMTNHTRAMSVPVH